MSISARTFSAALQISQPQSTLGFSNFALLCEVAEAILKNAGVLPKIRFSTKLGQGVQRNCLELSFYSAKRQAY
jgi:hypothetical protein